MVRHNKQSRLAEQHQQHQDQRQRQDYQQQQQQQQQQQHERGGSNNHYGRPPSHPYNNERCGSNNHYGRPPSPQENNERGGSNNYYGRPPSPPYKSKEDGHGAERQGNNSYPQPQQQPQQRRPQPTPPAPHPQRQEFKELMAIEDLKKRLETFDSFPETKKVSLLYQQQIPLPTRDPYPENWERELVRAKDVARRKIQSSFPKNQARTPPVETADSDTDSDEDSQENFSLYDDDVAHAMTHGSNSNNTAPTISMAETKQLLFLENVSRCVPIMTYGFHVSRGTNEEFCFCPCSNNSMDTVAGRWRSLCRMDENILPSCSKNLQKSPNEFIAHVRGVKGCAFHRILYDFLDELYRNFYGPDKKHIGFFQINDTNYRAAIKCIKKKEANQDKLVAEQMIQLKAQIQQLQKVSASAHLLYIYIIDWYNVLTQNVALSLSIVGK
jgi:hypothetical protein